MNTAHDLELAIRSHIPLITIQSHEEHRVISMISELAPKLDTAIFNWSVTEGLLRIDRPSTAQKFNIEPDSVLQHIKSSTIPGVYILLDFHPYLDNPIRTRLLKEIALGYDQIPRTIIFLSHEITLPTELRSHAAKFVLSLPSEKEIEEIVTRVAEEWSADNMGKKVKTERKFFSTLVKNLHGLTAEEVERLARGAIFDDGAITPSDLSSVMHAKYEMLNKKGVLSFEYDTAAFSDVAGLARLKEWLEKRRAVFQTGSDAPPQLDAPKGILLLGVQGCGKSLAAKAVAGTWGIPLLRFEFGAVYDKYIGETEKTLRESLRSAELMAPCVLWLDEIEKGMSTGDTDGGTSRRVLGLLLTWMAEKKASVFIVATANDIETLPPELIRKGRFDEIFFVDLPNSKARENIFQIHLRKRGLSPEKFELGKLSHAADGFSGAEIETAIVSSLYSAHAGKATLSTDHVIEELESTRPLSVVMAEQIEQLRRWARRRTVPAD